MSILTEDKNKSPIQIYYDDDTGNYYLHDGNKFVQIGTHKLDDKRIEIGDELSDEEKRRNNEERQAQIEKERKEAQAAKDAGEDYDEDALKDDETDEERQARIDNIQKIFSDEGMRKEATAESQAKVDRELARRKVGQKSPPYGSPIQRFEMSLEKFIKNEIRQRRVSTWQKPNMSYEGTGIYRQGRRNEQNKDIPSINVYFDQSGSWGEGDIKIGQEAIGVLNNYVRRKELKINVFYFANHVYDRPEPARWEGGTSAGPEILEHIRSTKPDNVIIMTDSDISLEGRYYYPSIETKDGMRKTDYDAPGIKCSPVKIKGARWCLWRGSADEDVKNYIQGKKLNEEYML